ncbi:sulfotransferase family 2 domain-containing protein [Humisphaera borealis]|uniref:Sulfotransferase family 2 domain-containing protein n=1 Tax=Humisphaera borealis TaxID=2807512 RepID=A0A7M2WVS9_9BACT|nr:sulfotransferase family 2 domain-containing protein [Humisphaera borealis]QOV89595.1 sulfotransferase family 2 domain-containing protein [Humisphaera borealis]
MGLFSRLKQSLTGSRRRSEPSPLRPGPNGTFVFIHINKCAGTSVGTAIGLPKKQHLTSLEVIDIIGEPAWSKAFRFTIVRNPWDKVVSHYKHRIKTRQTGLGETHVPFKQWVAATYGDTKDPVLYDQPKMFQQQVEWLKNRQGRIDVDYVGRFETMSETFDEVARRIGIDATLPHLNRTEGKVDFRTHYDDATAAIIASWFKDDIAQFGYEFRA